VLSTGRFVVTDWQVVPTSLDSVTVMVWPACAVKSSPEAVTLVPTDTPRVV